MSFDTQHHVSAAQIVQVVRKGTDGVQHTLRAPAGPVLDAFAFELAQPEQIVKVDGKPSGHAVAFAR